MRIAVHAAWLLAALLVIGSQRLLEMRVGAQGRRIPVYAVDPMCLRFPSSGLKRWAGSDGSDAMPGSSCFCITWPLTPRAMSTHRR